MYHTIVVMGVCPEALRTPSLLCTKSGYAMSRMRNNFICQRVWDNSAVLIFLLIYTAIQKKIPQHENGESYVACIKFSLFIQHKFSGTGSGMAGRAAAIPVR